MPNDPRAVQFGWHTAPWRSWPGTPEEPGAQVGVIRSFDGLYSLYAYPPGTLAEDPIRLPVRI